MKKIKLNKAVTLYWVSLVGSIASICALLFSLPILDDDWKIRCIVIASLFYIGCLLAIQFYMLIERSGITDSRDSAIKDLQKLDAYKASYQALHSISHKLRDHIQEYNGKPHSELKYSHKEFCLGVLDNLRNIFQSITGVSCATSIKAYCKEKDIMITIGRDCTSIPDRSPNDYNHKSSVDGNTASLRIIRNGEGTYFSNDLISAFEKGDYKNDRPGWQNYYKSTICWSIRYQNPISKKIDIFGLLCLDSPKPNVFDKKICSDVGSVVSDMTYSHFSNINIKDILDEVEEADKGSRN